MKKILLLFVLLCFLQNLQAATYYFSVATGDDGRTPLQAQDPETPWQSIERFNAFYRNLKPGDSVLFKRGEVFYGAMTVKTRGTPGGIIYYGAWGTGANPVISGFTTVTGWTAHGNGIYWAPLEAQRPNIVTINGEAKGMGRYPNSGYLKYENNNGNTSITDNELPASPSWTGAEVVIRKFRFILDRHPVTQHTGNTLQYSTSTTNGNNAAFNPVKGNGYFIQNHLGTLDQFGEWYYDSTAKRLYMHFGPNQPSGYAVRASTKEHNIFVSTAYFLKFENLDFEGANVKGLNLVNVSSSEVVNCKFYNQGGTAVYGIDLNAVSVSGVTIQTSFSNGINFEHNANNCSIDGVTVQNTYTISGTGRSGNGVGVGILVSGENNTIANNRVINSGYNGIQFLGNHVLVERNYVDTFCLLKDDGGGIYTYTGPSNEKGINRKIKDNVVLNAIGARAGAEAYAYEPFGKAAGIYLDEFANGIEITGNTIANGDWAGIFLHYAHSSQIRDNLFYNHRYQVYVSQFSPTTRHLLMTGNQYIARQAFQKTFYYHTTANDSPAAMGLFSHNHYARPLDETQSIQVDNFYTGGNGTLNLTLDQWRSTYQLDTGSQKSPLTFPASGVDNLRFEYNATALPKQVSLDATYIDVRNRPYAGTIILPAFSSVVLLRSAAAKTTQTISFPAIGNRVAGQAPFTVQASASSGLPVSFRVLSGPATVSGNTVTLLGSGTVIMAADQPGNETVYAAGTVTQSFTVSPNPSQPTPAKTAQTISFGSLGYKTWGLPPFYLAATASSGLPVSYRVVSGPATVVNRTVALIGVGTVVIEATQPGNDAFNAATPVTRSFSVGKSNQTLTFPAIPNKTEADQPFTLEAFASSQLPVSYKVVSGPATVSGNRVTLTGSGTVTIEAMQAGDELTNPTFALQRSFAVTAATGSTKAAQSISFSSISNKTFGEAPFGLEASASSGLPVSYRIVSGPASVSGSTVTINGAGSITIEASQAGNASYQAAAPVTQSFVVNKAVQSLSFGPLPDKTYGDAPFNLTATASSGLPVSFRVVSGPATLSGNTVTLTGTGTVSIEAAQNGSENYLPATPVVQSFSVASGSPATTKAAQSISFGTLGYKTFSSPPFRLTATASSGLPITYRVVSGPVAISGDMVSIKGVGPVTIEAMQAGNDAYYAATPVQRSFTVGKASQSISFPALANKTYGDAPFTLNATTTSGLPISYRIVSGPATVSGNTVTLNGAGTVSIEASQPGNANYSAAYPLVRSFTVQPAANAANTAHVAATETMIPAANGAQLSVYPNPLQDRGAARVIVQQSMEAVVNVYDRHGKLVRSLGKRRFEKASPVTIELDVQGLPAGTYLLQLSGLSGVFGVSFVVSGQ